MTLLPFEAVRQSLLDSARPVAECESVELAAAFDRVLAETLVSPLTVPPFDNSAMDGYALRAADVATPGVRLPVRLRVAAGDAPATLPEHAAARIFTGAPLPAGADTVVIQEDCSAEDDAVVFSAAVKRGENIRRTGSAMQRGQTLLAAGSRLSAAALGLAASVGIARVEVFRRLRVAVFMTGAELRLPGEPLTTGQIYSSNGFVIGGFLHQLGAETVDIGIVDDDLGATRDALRRAAAADVIITSGGMSVGEEDHVVAAVRAEGNIDVWKVAAKPGKPFAFGTVGKTPFIGLPGNPVAVWVGMLTLVLPYLRRCQGMTDVEPPRQRLRADFSYTVKGDRMEFVRVRRNADGGLDCYPRQDSAMISSAAWCDGLAAIPAGITVNAGDWVDYLPGPNG